MRASDRPDHDVPIFAMTANTFAADRKKCYDAGMSGYIPKPIDLETITHVLEEETGE
ncbi:response regulator [uncultured Gemmiger sp.]|uniref:response regulator n=1 Tax=uncultured Gemmiger sp. TaxID=1623490 RepID=UPI0025FEDA8B|nr:response regulator [uncultured Gemmiger sp.]